MHVYAHNCCTTHMLLPDPWPLINLYLSPLAKFIIIIREYYQHNYHIYKLACIHHNIYTQHYMVNAHICRSHRRVHLDGNTCLVDNSYSWFCPQNVLRIKESCKRKSTIPSATSYFLHICLYVMWWSTVKDITDIRRVDPHTKCDCCN